MVFVRASTPFVWQCALICAVLRVVGAIGSVVYTLGQKMPSHPKEQRRSPSVSTQPINGRFKNDGRHANWQQSSVQVAQMGKHSKGEFPKQPNSKTLHGERLEVPYRIEKRRKNVSNFRMLEHEASLSIYYTLTSISVQTVSEKAYNLSLSRNDCYIFTNLCLAPYDYRTKWSASLFWVGDLTGYLSFRLIGILVSIKIIKTFHFDNRNFWYWESDNYNLKVSSF